MSKKATEKQLKYARDLIQKTAHPMKVEENMSRRKIADRIVHLLKYKDNPKIKPLFLN